MCNNLDMTQGNWINLNEHPLFDPAVVEQNMAGDYDYEPTAKDWAEYEEWMDGAIYPPSSFQNGEGI